MLVPWVWVSCGAEAVRSAQHWLPPQPGDWGSLGRQAKLSLGFSSSTLGCFAGEGVFFLVLLFDCFLVCFRVMTVYVTHLITQLSQKSVALAFFFFFFPFAFVAALRRVEFLGQGADQSRSGDLCQVI